MTRAGSFSRTFLAAICALALTGLAAAESRSMTGRIVTDGNRSRFVTEDGRPYWIDGEAGNFLKYKDFHIEILNPSLPAEDVVRFTRYRILQSDAGEPIQSAVREIMTVKNKQPALEFQVQQQGSSVQFTLYLANRAEVPIGLKFPSTQRFDFVVMSADGRTALWRWSWGRTFDLGFNHLVIPPLTEEKHAESWDFRRSYIEDGEYVAFAEVHCLPHGMLSETRKFIVQSTQQRSYLQDSFLPLETGRNWTYQVGETDRRVEMAVTGSIVKAGRKYAVLSAFPDERILAGSGGEPADSRLVRFDDAAARLVEWTGESETVLFRVDEQHRLIPAEEACLCGAGRFTNCLEYRVLEDRRWTLRYRLSPGLGLLEVYLPRPEGEPVRLSLVDSRIAAGPPAPPKPPETPAAEEPGYQIAVLRKGGYPDIHRLISIRSNGTVVVLDHGAISGQFTVPMSRIWGLLQAVEQTGLYQLNDRYGQDDIENPLEIHLRVQVNGTTKEIHMRTSAKDKPPLAFWDIISMIESFGQGAPQAEK